MFKKIKNIKNIVIIFVATFLIFIIGSIVFLIISNIRINNKIDEIYDLLNKSSLRINN